MPGAETGCRYCKRARAVGRDARFIVLHRTNRCAVLVRRRGDGWHRFFRNASIAAAALCQRDCLHTDRGRISRRARETSHDEHGSALLRPLLLSER